MGDTLEATLREALAALHRAREELHAAVTIEARAVVMRQIAAAHQSVARALHLIGGSP